MKNSFAHIGRTLIHFVLVGSLILSCQKDNDIEIPLDDSTALKKHVRKRVKASEIPSVMAFISKTTNGSGRFSLKAIPGTREADLNNITIDSLDILVNTSDEDLSNYSFKIAPQQPIENATLNLVVKETSTGVYGYIIKYRVDPIWAATQVEGLDWSDYTGDIIFYRTDGTYVAKQTFANNVIVSRELIECPGETDDGNNNNGNGNTGGGGNGGGGNTGGGPGGDTGGNGNGGGNGGGTGGCDIVITNDCCNRGFCDIHAPREPQPLCSGTTTTINIICGDEDRSVEDVLRFSDPCCYDANGDPCPCASDGVSCLGDEGNNSTGVENEQVDINIPNTPCERLNHRSQNQEFMDNINLMNDASNVNPPSDRYENGFVMQGNIVNTQYFQVQGAANNPAINFDIPTGMVLDGYMHNHFFINETQNGKPMQSINTFSDHDLYFLYRFAKNGHINNTNSFTYIMVYQGNMYNLQINDIQQLINLGDSMFNGNNGADVSKLLFDEMQVSNIKHQNNQNTNRDNLARMLKKFKDAGFDMGVDLYASSIANPNWQKVTVDNSNTIVLENCN